MHTVRLKSVTLVAEPVLEEKLTAKLLELGASGFTLTESRGRGSRGIRASEIRMEHPWNTYVVVGLPPTPIANPGRASIAAVLDPMATDEIFFVADGRGGHVFARSLEEHNGNVAAWRAIEAARRERLASADASADAPDLRIADR